MQHQLTPIDVVFDVHVQRLERVAGGGIDAVKTAGVATVAGNQVCAGSVWSECRQHGRPGAGVHGEVQPMQAVAQPEGNHFGAAISES